MEKAWDVKVEKVQKKQIMWIRNQIFALKLTIVYRIFAYRKFMEENIDI